MNEEHLARELRRMYFNPPSAGQKTAIHLFGIKYAAELQGSDIQEVVSRAGLPKSYPTEIYNGMRLAQYVHLKEEP